jgi:hypothetical protein
VINTTAGVSFRQKVFSTLLAAAKASTRRAEAACLHGAEEEERDARVEVAREHLRRALDHALQLDGVAMDESSR